MRQLSDAADMALMIAAADMAANTYIDDLGPGNIFSRMDEFLISKMEKEESQNGLFHFLLDGSRCVKCLSYWFAVFLMAIRFASRPLFLFIAIPLVVSRAVVAIGSLEYLIRDKWTR